jgi:hypothetical protein
MRRKPSFIASMHPASQLPQSPRVSESDGDQDKNSSSTLKQEENKKDDGGKHVTFGTTEYFSYIQDEERFSHNCDPSKIPAPIRGDKLPSPLKSPLESTILKRRTSGETR